MNGRNSAGFLYMEHHATDCRETQESYLPDPETVDLCEIFELTYLRAERKKNEWKWEAFCGVSVHGPSRN